MTQRMSTHFTRCRANFVAPIEPGATRPSRKFDPPCVLRNTEGMELQAFRSWVLFHRRWEFFLWFWILCIAANGCDSADSIPSDETNTAGDERPLGVIPVASGPPEAKVVGILDRLLVNPKKIVDEDPQRVAIQFIEAAFRDADLATVIATIAWDHPRCRIGVFRCAELEGPAHRVGAVLALVPSEKLAPVAMDPEVFERDIAQTLQILTPAPDKELPYVPKSREALFSFQDHHGMPRYLLLSGAGKTWRVASMGRGEHIGL